MSFLKRLREQNTQRNLEWANGRQPNILFRATEFGGEAGEVLNEVKKLYREEVGWIGSRTTLESLEKEIGDVMITLDSVAAYYGIDLEQATTKKFNEISDKLGFPSRL